MPAPEARQLASDIKFLNACYRHVGSSSYRDIFSSEHRTSDEARKAVERLRALLGEADALDSVQITKSTHKEGRWCVRVSDSRSYSDLAREMLHATHRLENELERAQVEKVSRAVDQIKRIREAPATDDPKRKMRRRDREMRQKAVIGHAILERGFSKEKGGYRLNLSFEQRHDEAEKLARFLTKLDKDNPSRVTADKGKYYVDCKKDLGKDLPTALKYAVFAVDVTEFAHEQRARVPKDFKLTPEQQTAYASHMSNISTWLRKERERVENLPIPSKEREWLLDRIDTVAHTGGHYETQPLMFVSIMQKAMNDLFPHRESHQPSQARVTALFSEGRKAALSLHQKNHQSPGARLTELFAEDRRAASNRHELSRFAKHMNKELAEIKHELGVMDAQSSASKSLGRSRK